MRGDLEDTAEARRTVGQYQDLITAYRRVYLITPREKDVPTAMMIVGDLYRTMGRRFEAKYYRNAVDSYQLLLHEYPGSRYDEEALLNVAQIEQENLKDLPLAQKSYEAFLRMHPHSAKAVQARLAISQIADARRNGAFSDTGAKKDSATAIPSVPPPQNGTGSTAAHSGVGNQAGITAKSAVQPVNATNPGATLPAAINPAQKMDAPTSNRPVGVSAVKTWAMPDYTRVVISLQGPVKYQSARVANPDRIYFDVTSTLLDRSLLHAALQVQGDHVTAVRIAQYQANTVRVVLHVSHVKTYSVYLLRDPYRMVIDVYPEAVATSSAANTPAKTEPAHDARAEQSVTQVASKATDAPPAAGGAQAPNTSNGDADAKPSEAVASAKNPRQRVLTIADQEKAADAALAAATDDQSAAGAVPPPHSNTNPFAGTRGARTNSKSPKEDSNNKTAARSTASGDKPAAPTPAQPNQDGGRSLTRVLGLKIGRIVIDAGHGGHDTGTIGPTGLMEKDLCLDVALRLGKLIQQSLPGAEVVYTRQDDTFIPLERRTEIANEAKADLFISIHANSSGDRAARGVETYYLNFSPSREAMEVAARENATADQNIHDLDSLVQRIARNEKIEESKELAGDVQGALSKRLQRSSRAIKDRGVRKAPFVVLIGANMPSVLSEISFISNPTDESQLKKGENRQRIAEGLYKGMEAYLHSLNSVAYNQAKATTASRGGLPSTGNQP